MNPLIDKMKSTGRALALFGLVGAGLVTLSYQLTYAKIEKNERETLLRSLNVIVDESLYDNDLFSDTITMQNESFLGVDTPMVIHRARKAGQAVAAVINTVAPDGYNGRINLIVGIDFSGKILGVRVVKHKETPGLGDFVEIQRSNWITSFNGRTLENPKKEQWGVKRDGGVFDQFTGATITPRAVVKAVHKALLFYKQYRDELFAAPSTPMNSTATTEK